MTVKIVLFVHEDAGLVESVSAALAAEAPDIQLVNAPSGERAMGMMELSVPTLLVVDAELAGLGDFDPYSMVIVGFQNPLVVIFYLIAMTLLCSHLSHGVASIFQTLGLRSKKAQGAIKTFSLAYTLAIWAGFISIPLAIYAGFLTL